MGYEWKVFRGRGTTANHEPEYRRRIAEKAERAQRAAEREESEAKQHADRQEIVETLKADVEQTQTHREQDESSHIGNIPLMRCRRMFPLLSGWGSLSLSRYFSLRAA